MSTRLVSSGGESELTTFSEWGLLFDDATFWNEGG